MVTFLDVIGNIGGFNDAVWLFFSIFLTTYSSLMFMRSVAKKSPFRSSKTSSQDQVQMFRRSKSKKTFVTSDSIGQINKTLSKDDLM